MFTSSKRFFHSSVPFLHRLRWPSQNPYRLMGIAPNAKEVDVRKAYRRLCLVLHPDRNMGNPKATERFQELQDAFHVLNTPSRRIQLNRGLSEHRTYSDFLRSTNRTGTTAAPTSTCSTSTSFYGGDYSRKSTPKYADMPPDGFPFGFYAFRSPQDPFDYASGPGRNYGQKGQAGDDDKEPRFSRYQILLIVVGFCLLELIVVVPWMQERRYQARKEEEMEGVLTRQELARMREKHAELVKQRQEAKKAKQNIAQPEQQRSLDPFAIPGSDETEDERRNKK